MVLAERYLRYRAANGHIPRGRRWLVVADVVGVAVPELAVRSTSPAADGSAAHHRARVFRACGDLDRDSSEGHVTNGGWRFVVPNREAVPIAELP
jgi:hypothetical protein